MRSVGTGSAGDTEEAGARAASSRGSVLCSWRRGLAASVRGAAVALGLAAVVLSGGGGVRASDADPTRVLCSHPFANDHPLVADFLRPWANGIQADSRGALVVDLVSATAPLDTCALAPVDSPLGAFLALPFQMPDDALKASALAYASLRLEEAQRGETSVPSFLLAAVMLPHDMVAAGDSPFPPLPGGLDGQVLRAPTAPVAALLAELGAEVTADTEAPVTARLESLAVPSDAAWAMTFDAGRSLHSRPFALRLGARQMAGLPAAFQALLTQVPGPMLSAAGGRALNRARAVGLETVQSRNARVALSEDMIGHALSVAETLSATWRAEADAHETAHALFRAAEATLNDQTR